MIVTVELPFRPTSSGPAPPDLPTREAAELKPSGERFHSSACSRSILCAEARLSREWVESRVGLGSKPAERSMREGTVGRGSVRSTESPLPAAWEEART